MSKQYMWVIRDRDGRPVKKQTAKKSGGRYYGPAKAAAVRKQRQRERELREYLVKQRAESVARARNGELRPFTRDGGDVSRLTLEASKQSSGGVAVDFDVPGASRRKTTTVKHKRVSLADVVVDQETTRVGVQNRL